jgi:hypothetical protein
MSTKNRHHDSLQEVHSDPLLHPHQHVESSDTASTTRSDGTSAPLSEVPMGGAIGSIVSSVNQEEASDTFAPGRNVSYSGIRSNITIQSDLVEKKSNDVSQTKERSNNLISNLLQSSSSTDQMKKEAGVTPAMDAHIRTLHQIYKRRFQNRPSNQESKHYNINPEPCKSKYQVTKLRSWRIGYSRILSFHSTYFTTLDPESHEITNLWYYNQVRHYMALPNEPDCMLIEVIDNGTSIKLKLKCRHGERNQVLSDFVELKYWDDVRVRGDLIQREQHSFFENCYRQKRDGSKVSTSLLCAPFGILEIDAQSEAVLRTFLFRCIRAISFLNEESDGIVLHLNETNQSMDILDQQVFYIQSKRIGGSGRSEFVTIMKNKFELLNMKWVIAESATLESVLLSKGLQNSIHTVGECISSHLVKRISPRNPRGSDRLLLLSQKGFILEQKKERKGNSPAQISMKSGSLHDVTSIVRHSSLFPPLIDVTSIDCNKCFTLEYKSGLTTTYVSENRDEAIVSLLDVAIYTCKNFNVTVTHMPSQSYKIKRSDEAPEDVSQNINLFVSDPCELQCLRILHEVATVSDSILQLLGSDDIRQLGKYVNECYALVEMCHEFNANVTLESTTLLPNDEKLITETIASLWSIVSILARVFLEKEKTKTNDTDHDFLCYSFNAQVCSILQCLYRLMITPKGYETTAQNEIARRLFCDLWKFHDPFVQYWFLKTLSALVLPLPFSTSRDIELESMNKSYLLAPKSSIASGMISSLLKFKYDQNSLLLLMVASNILESILCSHHDTTSSDQVAHMMDILIPGSTCLLSLLNGSCSVISENIVLLLQVISNYSMANSNLLRELSLSSGLLLKHFYLAIYGSDEGQRYLSRFLCSIWLSGPPECAQKQFLKRLVPSGFMSYLNVPALSSREEEDLDIVDYSRGDHDVFNHSTCVFDRSGINKVRFRTKITVAQKIKTQGKLRSVQENFRIFFHMLTQDHSLPDLIWNGITRSEFKKEIEQTLEAVQLEVKNLGSIEQLAWNHQQFKVQYTCLQNEIQVGSIYLRLWLDTNESFIRTLKDPLRFFEALYRRMLYEMDNNVNVVIQCIQSIERLYLGHSKVIGVFPELHRLLHQLVTTNSKETRDCLISLLEVVVGIHEQEQELYHVPANIEQLLNQECIDHLCSMVMESRKNINSSLFGLRCLTQIVLVHKDVNLHGVPFFPIPLAKTLLCDESSGALSILCQTILTDDRRLVENAAMLIDHLMIHNDSACQKLYLSGIFYFILRSKVENWEPLAQLLYDTHLKQDCNCSFTDTAIMSVSVLHHLLPIGLIRLLIRHGPVKFSKIFVSDCDSPEVIWNRTMRNNLVNLIEEHISDFFKLFQEDNSSTYRFLAIPPIFYDGIDDELFCHGYYLCNLCNESKYPEFSVEEPKLFFIECIETWKRLLGKSNQQSIISVDEALSFFGLANSNNDIELRAAYRKRMSTVDVADQDQVAKILKFYNILSPMMGKPPAPDSSAPIDEFHLMSSFTDKDAVGLRITKDCLYPTWLLMKAQLLVCKKYPSCIEQMNYPAYDSILLCLELPTDCNLWDTIMERGRARLIRIATELLFYTCLVSPSNAEALVKAGGVHSLVQLMHCYISTINKTQLETESDPDVIKLLMETLTYVVKTLSGVAYFPDGLRVIESLPKVSKFCFDWCSCIHLNFLRCTTYGCNLLRRFALEGIGNLSRSTSLQNNLYERGVVWNLIHIMMDFDENFRVTVLPEEVFKDSISEAETNYQAALASRALGMLCGVMKEELSTPINYDLFAAMKKILTVPIANMLQDADSEKILRTLNCRLETPLLLWDMNMRSELSNLVSNMELKQRKDPDFFDDLLEANKFIFSNLTDDVNIGGVYIRIFNGMDEHLSINCIPDCQSFAKSLIGYLGRSLLNEGIGVSSVSKDLASEKDYPILDLNSHCAVDDESFYMVVVSLARLVRMEGTIDKVLCERGSPTIIVSFLALPFTNRAASVMVDILMQISTKQAFAEAVIQEKDLLPWVFSRLEISSVPEANSPIENDITYKTWIFIENLASFSIVASYMITSCAWIELLSLATNNSRFRPSMATREGAAKSLARLLFDANSSATIGNLLRKLLPAPLVIELKENGAGSLLQSFDHNSNTPEFIWDESMREELNKKVLLILDSIMDEQGNRIIPQSPFSLPKEFELKYSRLENEILVAGLYLERFLDDPSYSPRDPIGSLEGLMVKYFQCMESFTNSTTLEPFRTSNVDDKTYHEMSVVTRAIVELCTANPFLYSKLSLWTYTRQLIFFLHKCISVGQLGRPLLFTVKLILLSANDMENIEDICGISDDNGKGGIVDGIIQAINGNPIHPESDVMIECLEKVFRLALGDLESCNHMSSFTEKIATSDLAAMAPSPAPTGSDSVSKMKRVNVGDDPLAMIMGSAPCSTTQSLMTTKSSNHIRKISYGRSSNAQSVSIDNDNAETLRLESKTNRSMKVSEIQSSRIQTNQSYQYPSSPPFALGSTRQTNMIQNRFDTQTIQSSNEHPNAKIYQKSNPESLKQLSSEGRIMRSNDFQRSLPQYPPTNSSDSNRLPSYQNYDAQYSVPVINPQDETTSSQKNNLDLKDVELHSDLKSNIGIILDTGLNAQGEVSPVSYPHFIAEEKRKQTEGAKGCAKKRTVLLDSAIKCRLPSFLVVNVLDNEIWEGVANPSKTKSCAISLLNLLLRDPGYGSTFKLMLDECPTWDKHRQRRDNASDPN